MDMIFNSRKNNTPLSSNRQNIAVMFGGKSVEHEISVITGLEFISAIDTTKYRPVPVYVDITGRWFTGKELLDRTFYKKLPGALNNLTEVTLLPIPGTRGLTVKDGDSWLPPEKNISIDAFILAFHGQFGEDGCMQGLCELADVPYAGCGVMAASVAMNKYVCKMFLLAHGIPALPAYVVHKAALARDLNGTIRNIRATHGLKNFPLFIKPGNLGSSIGISKASDEASLKVALAKALKYDEEVIVEPCVAKLMEINVSVSDGDDSDGLQAVASVVEIPFSSAGTLTYEDKYLRGGKGKGNGGARGMASLVRVIDPPDLAPEYREKTREYAESAYKLLQCHGVVRFDFMVDLDTGKLYFNELNSFPGSLAYYLWAKSHPQVLYTDTTNRMIARALRLHAQKSGLVRNMGFKALFR